METFYHIADYHNQFYLTPDGKLHSYLKSYTGTITPETIRDFKLKQTEWGQKRPNDILRRYNNIVSICRVSVPVWRIILSDPLQIVALVGLYPTN